jgi:hypothetical protein
MKTEMVQTMEMLKERVELNKQLISTNKQLLLDIVNLPLSDQRTELFKCHFKKNMELFSSNYMFIKLQYELHRAILQEDGLKTFGMMSLS